ncbi:1485_t:CDS:2 [Entrophospora sp. SA101]|nr:1485_t:CDS:2 [Entrophospora sp. SA101]
MVSVIILFEIVYWNYRLILRLRSSNDDHNDNESNNNVEGDYGHNNSDMVIINNGHTIVNDELPPYRYNFNGSIKICQTVFMKLCGIKKEVFDNIKDHYKKFGLDECIHGNTGRRPEWNSKVQ